MSSILVRFATTARRWSILAAAGATLALGPLPGTRTGTIVGTVRDQTGAPIARAQVLVEGTAIRAIADSSGKYELARVPAGTVTLRARLIGYKATRVVGLRVRAGQTVTQDIRLESSPVQVTGMTTVAADNALPAREEVDQRADAIAPERGIAGQARSKLSAHDYRVGGQLAPAPAAAPHVFGAFNTEDYHHIEDNRFQLARTSPLSTFSIDVDAASYANVRRFLTSGQRPPADAVRIEEMVNYFHYAYPDPRGDLPFSITTDVAAAPWRPAHRLVRIGIQGKRVPMAELPPNNLVFLIDVSGSMNDPAKLPLVKRAFQLLVNELRPQDRVAIVVYAGAAGLVLPSTPGNHKERILQAIECLEAGGSTAGGAGIQLAYQVAREHHLAEGNNRVILATDGDFNVGVSSEGELVRLVEAKREQGTYLTVLGFGTGNLKDAKMEQLADKGNGHYAYVDDILEARKVFVHELGATLLTIAKDVKIQVEFNPARVGAYRLVGYENRMLRNEDFNDDRKDAGELGAGHSVTALYEVVPAGVALDPALASVDSLRYQTPAPRESDGSDDLLTVKLRYKSPAGGPSRLIERPVKDQVKAMPSDFRFAAGVAAFGMILRDSRYRGSATFDDVVALARGAGGEDPGGYRAEFLRLVDAARGLDVAARTDDD